MSLNQLSLLERNATSYIFYEHLASLLNKELFFFPLKTEAVPGFIEPDKKPHR